MKVFVISDAQDPANPYPLAVYDSRREGDAKRVCDLVKGRMSGPIEINRDIPDDGRIMYRVELTKDGAVRSISEHSILHVLQMNLIAGWSVAETKSRWRLNALVWAKTAALAEAAANSIYRGIVGGSLKKSGVL